jgi:hypothetical protein
LQKLQNGSRADLDAPDMVLLEPRLILRSSPGDVSLTGTTQLPALPGLPRKS